MTTGALAAYGVLLKIGDGATSEVFHDDRGSAGY